MKSNNPVRRGWIVVAEARGPGQGVAPDRHVEEGKNEPNYAPNRRKTILSYIYEN